MIVQYLKKFMRDKAGNVAMTFGIALVPIMFSVGITIDYSEISRIKSRLQETSDSAALYAIKGLRDGGYDEENIDQLAYNNVVSNYDIDTVGIDIGVDIHTDTLTVQLETIYDPAFLRAFGHNETKIGAFTEVAYAVNKEAVKCLISLNKTTNNALNLVGNSIIGANECAIHVNSSSYDAVDLDGGGTSITAQEVCIVGDVQSGLNRISPPPPKNCERIDDPFDNWELPVVGSCDYNNFMKNNSGSIYPGVYCGGLSVGGNADITVEPGLYIIKDGEFNASGSARLYGDGVTFFLTGDDMRLNFGGNTNFDFTAMSTGELAGFIFYFDPASPISGSTSQFSGNPDTYFEGIMYLGGHEMEINGDGSVNTTSPFSIIVADTVKLNGNATVTFNVERDKTDLEVPDELFYRSVTARIIR